MASWIRSSVVVMAARTEVTTRLAKAPDPGDGFGDDGERAFTELERLGVLRVRPDGRVDVPDLYRYGYEIKRKGGVARPR
ncbi:MAG: hypothetical protein WCK05_03645 [Planctomycetota bacterium]